MFNKSLSDNGAVGVYKSVIDSTCCYCGDRVSEGEIATFLLSKERVSGNNNKEGNVKLYIVEMHIKCTVDMAKELVKIDISSLNDGDKVTSSATIVYGYMSNDIECIICGMVPQNRSKAIVFSSTELKSDEIDSNVWCHPHCLDEVCESLEKIEQYVDEILAEEI